MFNIFHHAKKYVQGGSLEIKHNAELDMVKGDIMKLQEYSLKISELLKDNDEVEAWVISKLAKVEQTTANVKHALEAEYPNKFEHGGSVKEHYDGEIVKMMCLHIHKYASKMLDVLAKEHIEFQEWMKHELSIAGAMIDSVYHYMDYFVSHTKLSKGGGISKKGFYKEWVYDGKEIIEKTYVGDTKYFDIKQDFPSIKDSDFEILDSKGEIEIDGYTIHGERGFAGIKFIAHKEVKLELGGDIEYFSSPYTLIPESVKIKEHGGAFADRYKVEVGEEPITVIKNKKEKTGYPVYVRITGYLPQTVDVFATKEAADKKAKSLEKQNKYAEGGNIALAGRKKVAKVMHEFKHGKLKSHGHKVTDYKQAIAIALNEAGLSRKEEGGSLEIESFKPPESDDYGVGNCGIPSYNTALDHWALYYEKGGSLEVIEDYEKKIMGMTNNELAHEYHSITGIPVESIEGEINNEKEKDGLIAELIDHKLRTLKTEHHGK